MVFDIFRQMFLTHMIKRYSFLTQYYIKEQSRNLTLHTAAPRVALNFLFLLRELVFANPDNALQECCYAQEVYWRKLSKSLHAKT